jgi:hypothetical protein
MSIWKDGKPLFAGDKYADLSDEALYFIGGILKHAKALNAFTNPSTNSYKRLIPGFEAPVLRAYSARNRSGCVRIPWTESPKAKRVEARFPDPSANPYLCFAALLMAGLDGIENKIHPGEPSDKDLYDLPPEELAGIPTVCAACAKPWKRWRPTTTSCSRATCSPRTRSRATWSSSGKRSTPSSTPPPGRVRHVLQLLIRRFEIGGAVPRGRAFFVDAKNSAQTSPYTVSSKRFTAIATGLGGRTLPRRPNHTAERGAVLCHPSLGPTCDTDVSGHVMGLHQRD